MSRKIMTEGREDVTTAAVEQVKQKNNTYYHHSLYLFIGMFVIVRRLLNSMPPTFCNYTTNNT